MKRYEDYTDDELKAINETTLELTGVTVVVTKDECKKARACVPGEYFEQIEKCKLCRKLI